LVDTHSELRAGWAGLIRAKKAEDPKIVSAFIKPPLSEEEFYLAMTRWDNEVYRNQTINQWVQSAKAKYAAAK